MTEQKKRTIALIEDEESLLGLYETRFRLSGFTVVTAADGKAGLELVRQHKPDLVLLDILMPGMSGFEVLAELKKDAATKNIPVVLLTNLAEDAGLEKGQSLGADAYVMKVNNAPEQVVQLANAIINTKAS